MEGRLQFKFKMFPKKEFTDLLQNTSEAVKNCKTEVRKTTNYSITYNTEHNKVIAEVGRKNVNLNVPVDVPRNVQAFVPLMKGLAELKLATENPFEHYLGVGDHFKPLVSLSQVKKEGFVNLAHQQGKVLVLDFWGTWAPQVIPDLVDSQQVIAKNKAKWGDQVAFVTIGYNDKGENLAKAVTELKLDDMLHFRISNFRPEEGNSLNYGCDQVPKRFIIDKWGKVRFVIPLGTPHNKEQNIEYLLSETSEKKFENLHFKTLKKYFKDVLINKIAENRNAFINFSFHFRKRAFYDFEGKVGDKVFIRPKLEIMYKKKYEAKVKALVADVLSTLPEGTISHTLTVSDLKTAKLESSKIAVEALSYTGLPSTLKQVSTSSYVMLPHTDFLTWNVRKAIYEPINLPVEQMEAAQSFNKAVHSKAPFVTSAESAALLQSIVANASVKMGEQFKPFTAVEIETGAPVKVEGKIGNASIITFWGSMVPPSMIAMDQVNTVLQKNSSEWQGKVNAFSVCVDQDEEIINKILSSKPMESMRHYKMIPNSPVGAMYNLNMMPVTIIVNKFGKIAFIGNPAAIKLEETIVKILTREDKEAEATVEKFITQEEYKKLRKYLKESDMRATLEKTFIKSGAKDKPLFNIILSKINEFNGNGPIATKYKIFLHLSILEQEFPFWKPYTDQLVSFATPDKFEAFKLELLKERPSIPTK